MLTVDITPVAFNRTAVFHIGRQIVKILLENNIPFKLRALLTEIPVKTFVSKGYRVPFLTTKCVQLALSRQIKKQRYVDRKNAPVTPGSTLYLDALYPLFHPLCEKEWVFVYDLTPHTMPSFHNPDACALYTRAFSSLSNPRVTVVASSQSTQRDLWENFGVPEARTKVLYLGNRFNREKQPETKPQKKFILFVGGFEVRKNIAGLIRGYHLSGLWDKGVYLYLVGGGGLGAQDILSLAQKTPGVECLGHVSDTQLNALYDACLGFALPSFWEGFGVPALEALAKGVPCLLSNTGALPEVGGEFALYVDPHDDNAIAQQLNHLVEKGAQLLTPSEKLEKHLEKFQFDRNFLSLFEEWYAPEHD